MPPRKRKAPEPPRHNATPPPARSTRSVTRSEMRLTRAAAKRLTESGSGYPSGSVASESDRKRKKVKQGVKVQQNKKKKEEGDIQGATSSSSNGKTIVIERCTQCKSFTRRATEVKEGLEEKVPGINVIVNPEKPRRGCFEIREEGGKNFISLLGMKRPFKPMMDLDMGKVIADIIEKINH